MVRKSYAAPITTKMYRHFAAVTLVVTAATSMFANGESREAVSREVSARQQTVPRVTSARLVRRAEGSPPRMSSGAGFDGEFGEPMDRLGATPGGSGIDPLALDYASGSGIPADFTTYGVSEDEWNAMSPVERKALIAKVAAEKAKAVAPQREQEIASLLEASRARSGVGTLSQD